jgi:signal transduction histidine kinase
VAEVLLGLTLLATFRPWAGRRAYAIAGFPVLVIAGMCAALIVATDTPRDPIYVGLILGGFGVGVFYPWPPHLTLVATLVLWAAYLAASLITGAPFTRADLLHAHAHLATLVLIATGATTYFHRLERQDFHARVALAQANERLREADRLNERLATVGRVGVTVAHQVNNSLAGLMGLAQMLQASEGAPWPEIAADLRSIERIGVEIDWLILHDGRFVPLPPGPDGILRSRVFPGLWLDRQAMIEGNAARVVEVLQTGLKTPEHAAFVTDLRRRKRTV